MEQEEIVLCGSSAYTKKFYLNPLFNGLPEGIKEDLNILCVLVRHVQRLVFFFAQPHETQQLQRPDVSAQIVYDEIGSVLKIKQMQREKTELFESLEMYYRVFFLGEEFTEDKED